MKKFLTIIFALTTIAGVSQNQNTRLSENLLLSVQSGANSLSGTNLVTNGTFDTSTTGWTVVNGSLSVSSGKIVLTSSGSSDAYTYQTGGFATEIGETYILTFAYQLVTADYCQVYIGNSAATKQVYDSGVLSSTSLTQITVYIKPLATTTYITLLHGGTVGETSYWDNIVIRKINTTALTLPDPSYSMTNTSAIPTYGHKGNSSYWAFDGVDDVIATNATCLNTGTGSYSIIMKFRPLSYANALYLIDGRDGTNDGIRVYAGTATGFTVQHNAISTTTAYNFAIGTTYTVAVSGTYGATCKIFVDGTEVTYTAQPTINTEVAVTTTAKIGANIISSVWGNQDIWSCRIFNYALSESDVTYYSSPASHLKAVDQGATGVDLLTGNNSTFNTGIGDWINVSNAVFDANSTVSGKGYVLGDGGNDIIRLSVQPFTPMKIYRGTIKARLNTGSTALLYFGADGLANVDGYSFGFTPTGTEATYSGNFLLNTSGDYLYIGRHANIDGYNGSAFEFDDLSAVQLGCLLDLTAEGMISPTLWRDWYHSTDIALTGATAPRLVKSNLTAWRFNGTSSYLSLADASAPQLTGDVTISFWAVPTALTNYGAILINQKLDLYSTSTGLLWFFRDGSTTLASSEVLALDTWKHIVITSNSVGYSQIYINGALVTSGSAGTPVEGTGALTIGNNGSFYFQGIIEGFKINKEYWSAEKVLLDYQAYND